MPSRNARKRYRRRLQVAEATARRLSQGDGGGPSGLLATRSDIARLRRAVTQGWDVPADVRVAVELDLCEELRLRDMRPDRHRIALARLALALHRLECLPDPRERALARMVLAH